MLLWSGPAVVMTSPEFLPLLSVLSMPMLLIPLWGYSYLLLFELFFFPGINVIIYFFFLSPSGAKLVFSRFSILFSLPAFGAASVP